MAAGKRVDPTTVLQHIDCGQEESTPNNLASVINKAFLSPMSEFTPLPPISAAGDTDSESELIVTEEFVLKKLAVLNPTKASGPDSIPSWLLKENADILTRPITTIMKSMNSTFCEAGVPQSWKKADIIPRKSQYKT